MYTEYVQNKSNGRIREGRLRWSIELSKCLIKETWFKCTFWWLRLLMTGYHLISFEVYHITCWTTALRMSTWLFLTHPLIFRIAIWTHLSWGLTRLSHPGREKVQSSPMSTAAERAVQADCLHASQLFFMYGSPVPCASWLLTCHVWFSYLRGKADRQGCTTFW